MEEIRFDDIESLRKHVSEEYGPWGAELTVTQEMIDEFAELTGDRQWIHIDVERCQKESPFGTTIAHGFLTLSLLPKLAGGSRQSYRIVGAGNVTNYGADGFRFLSPVPAGSTLHAHSRLEAVEGTPKGTRVKTGTAIHVVGSDRPALVYEGITLYQAPR